MLSAKEWDNQHSVPVHFEAHEMRKVAPVDALRCMMVHLALEDWRYWLDVKKQRIAGAASLPVQDQSRKGAYMKKSIWTLACLSAIGIFSRPIQADTVQIGTFSVSNSLCPDGVSPCFYYSISNLMTDTTMTATGGTWNGLPLVGVSRSILPGASAQMGSGVARGGNVDAMFSYSGNLSSLDFTVGGTQYRAASLIWTTPELRATPSGSVAINITAAPVLQAVPEPSSVLLLGIVLAGLAVYRTHSGSVGDRSTRGSE